MSHYPNRRTFLDAPHSHTRSQRTASPMHSQSWSDLHQQRQDQLDAARGIFYGLCLAGGLWLMVFIGVFAAVWLLG
jgi:hypothetical protein